MAQPPRGPASPSVTSPPPNPRCSPLAAHIFHKEHRTPKETLLLRRARGAFSYSPLQPALAAPGAVLRCPRRLRHRAPNLVVAGAAERTILLGRRAEVVLAVGWLQLCAGVVRSVCMAPRCSSICILPMGQYLRSPLVGGGNSHRHASQYSC